MDEDMSPMIMLLVLSAGLAGIAPFIGGGMAAAAAAPSAECGGDLLGLAPLLLSGDMTLVLLQL